MKTISNCTKERAGEKRRQKMGRGERVVKRGEHGRGRKRRKRRKTGEQRR